MLNNELYVPRGVVSMTGTCVYRILGKMGGSREGSNSRPAVVAEKSRRRMCVRGAQWERGRGGVWGKRLSLETSEKLESVNYVTKMLYDM